MTALDVAIPTIMRGPGEATGMFAIESAMDELAFAAGIDPVEFRVRNEPVTHPESGLPFSSRHLVTCLRAGARRFGWAERDPAVRVRREADWLVGTGVDGRYTVLIGAADIGTWTALTQIAAEALAVAVKDVTLEIGDTDLPGASSAGFSSGINCWGTTVYEAAGRLRALVDAEHGGTVPTEGVEASADMPDNPYYAQYVMYSFGAQFAELRVHEDTGEVRVPRLLGVFDAGRIINPKTARSQLIGGMTQGLSMALHEASVIDPRFGHVVNNDLGAYHFAANADIGSMEVHCLDVKDAYINPMGSKGIGEVSIVGTAAAIANAVHHATGIRVRDLPITLDKLLP